MKGFQKFLYKVLYPACLIFTVTIFTAFGIATAAKQEKLVPDFSFMFLLLLFSVSITLVNLILDSKFNSAVKYALHFFCTMVSFILVFIVFTGYYERGSTAVIIIIFAALAYFIVFAAIMALKSVFGRKKNEQTAYKSQFGG